jgi:hypothetical protein
VSQPARPRGRPAQDWRLWPSLAALPVGTALLIDAGNKRSRLVGRLVHSTPAAIHVVDRRLALHTVTPEHFRRARVLPGLFEPDAPAFLRGQSQRCAVMTVDGSRVLVEFPDGTTQWLDETAIEHADDRDLIPTRR